MSCQECQRFVCKCSPRVVPSDSLPPPFISWTSFSEKMPQDKTQIIFREGNRVGIGWFMTEDTSEWRGKWIAVIDLLHGRMQLHHMEHEDGKVGWYFNCDRHYIDVEKDDNGKYSIFFRDRKTMVESWFDQADWPDTVEYNNPANPWWLNELTKCWHRGEFTDTVRRAAKVACDMFVPYPVEINVDESALAAFKAEASEPTEGMVVANVQALSHTWDDAGEKCTRCGASDWMAGDCIGDAVPSNVKEVSGKDENLLALHRKLAAAELEAHQWKQRYENANKDRNELRASMALTMPDPSLLPHQQRVVDEAAALDKKLTALAAFLGTERFYGLSMTECKRLQRQHGAMADYSSILRERIGDF